MQPIPYREVFVVHGPTFGDLLPAWVFAIVSIALAALVLDPHLRSTLRPGSLKAARIGAYVFPLLTLLVARGIISEFQSVKARYRRGDYSVAEGVVSDFTPGAATGHRDESFRVGEQEFRYSAATISPYFNRVAGKGGPIRPGLRVRISHVNGDILRLEIAP